MKKPSKYAIKRARTTLVGRVLCRLLGEQTGAVLMEYVVLGAMVAAAAVALILLFGKGIRQRLSEMIDALLGKPKVVVTVTPGDVSDASDRGDDISGAEE